MYHLRPKGCPDGLFKHCFFSTKLNPPPEIVHDRGNHRQISLELQEHLKSVLITCEETTDKKRKMAWFLSLSTDIS